MELISAIIASTIPADQEADTKRVDVLFTEETIKHINAQINIAHENGNSIPVFDRMLKGRGDKPDKIGEIVAGYFRYDDDYEIYQAVAEIHIFDDALRNALKITKKEKCFVPSIGYNNVASLRKNGDSLPYLQPPFKIMFCSIAEKRAVSDPYLIIL